jgi:hypothetical protein
MHRGRNMLLSGLGSGMVYGDATRTPVWNEKDTASVLVLDGSFSKRVAPVVRFMSTKLGSGVS